MAGTIHNMRDLDAQIEVLQTNRKIDWIEIKATSEALADSLKPQNMVRQVISEYVADRNMQQVLKRLTSIGVGFLAHKITIGKRTNPIARVFSRALQMGITGLFDRILLK